MVSRRFQTTMPNTGQSVRFYKVVALSFLALTLVLLGVIVFMSSKRATITITTEKDQAKVSSDVVIGGNSSQSFGGMVTTTLVTVEQSFSPTGNREEPAKAEGVVTLFNETDTAQTLVATTRLLSTSGVLFRIKEAVTIPAQGSIQTVAAADVVGVSGNIPPTAFTIPGLNEAKQKVIYAKSDAPMTGGLRSIGVVSSADVEKASQLLEAALMKQGETVLRATFSELSGVFHVNTSTIDVVGNPIGTEVGEFSLRGTAEVVGAFYSPGALKEWARNEILRHTVEEAEKITPSESQPTATFVKYESADNSATLHVFYDGIVTINPESKQLSKSAFFGKSADEIRRYLLSLKHIQNVEIEFRPVWMRTVPPVADHVSVIIKEVE